LRAFWLGIALAACVSAGAADSAGPVKVHLRNDEPQIRAAMLTHTPLGSTKASVLAYINTRLTHEGAPQFSKFGARKRNYGANNPDDWIGTSGINDLEVGHYGEWEYLLLIKTYVYLSWGFDANDRLIDIVVYKETDSL